MMMMMMMVIIIIIVITSCGAGHNKPRLLANATDSEIWPVITNNLTFDPPTRLPELTRN